MLLLDLTLPGAAENVALDEALLDEAEASSSPHELLRWWEPAAPLVVLGRSSKPEVEVRLDACARAGVPVIRRTSGGATIITGPGLPDVRTCAVVRPAAGAKIDRRGSPVRAFATGDGIAIAHSHRRSDAAPATWRTRLPRATSPC